jgi:hypothetical protein
MDPTADARIASGVPSNASSQLGASALPVIEKQMYDIVRRCTRMHEGFYALLFLHASTIL